jgi:hypothetical protein
LASQHVKIPPFRSIRTYVHDNFGSASRTTRLATVTAAAALAAVAAGVSATPALAATGTLASAGGSTLASSSAPASHAGVLSLDAASVPVPLGLAAATAGHQPVAPLAVPAAAGPLTPLARPAPAGPLAPLARAFAAPHQLPVPKRPVVRIGLANAASKAANTVVAGTSAAQPAAAAHPQQPAQHQAPPPPPPPAPKPYLIYDSVTPRMIPAGQQVATYATGGYAVPAAQVAGRGNVLWIDTQGTDPAASALDVEPGDATPSIAAAWAWHKLSAAPGAVARIYTMISEWPAVRAAIGTLPQRMQSQIRYWIADPTGVPHVLPGASATQWYWGKNYDISTANPGF